MYYYKNFMGLGCMSSRFSHKAHENIRYDWLNSTHIFLVRNQVFSLVGTIQYTRIMRIGGFLGKMSQFCRKIWGISIFFYHLFTYFSWNSMFLKKITKWSCKISPLGGVWYFFDFHEKVWVGQISFFSSNLEKVLFFSHLS